MRFLSWQKFDLKLKDALVGASHVNGSWDKAPSLLLGKIPYSPGFNNKRRGGRRR